MLEQAVKEYAEANEHPITVYEDITCSCGNTKFNLFSDDEEGGAYIVCTKCSTEHDVENSKKYIEERSKNFCNCDNDELAIGIGKAFYKNSNDPQWIYVGAICHKCQLAGVYVDWKEN